MKDGSTIALTDIAITSTTAYNPTLVGTEQTITISGTAGAYGTQTASVTVTVGQDDLSAEELINIDAKVFEKEDTKFEIAQVNTVSIEDVLKRETELKAVMNETIQEKGLSLFVLAITDILNSNSEIIALGEKSGVIKVAFGKDLVNDRAFLEGVVSRKKQLLPDIDKNI